MTRSQLGGKLRHRDVGFLFDTPHQKAGISRQLTRAPRTPLRCRLQAARALVTRNQLHRERWAHVQVIRRPASRSTVCDPTNDRAAFSPEAERYWMNVDLYVGGAEHAVLHLLYARFWHKVLFDVGLVRSREPFQRQEVGRRAVRCDLRRQCGGIGNLSRTGADIVRSSRRANRPNVQRDYQGLPQSR